VLISANVGFNAEARVDNTIIVWLGVFEGEPGQPAADLTDNDLYWLLGHEYSHLALQHAGRDEVGEGQRKMARDAARIYQRGAMLESTLRYSEATPLSGPARLEVRDARETHRRLRFLMDSVLYPSWGRAQEDEADVAGYDATVLVGDFGGGTSDFSLVRFTHQDGHVRSQALSNAGVGVAGDAFDYRIIDHLVSPRLGKGSLYRAFDNVIPLPNRYFTAFARWEQLALLRASRDMRDIRRLVRDAVEPEKLQRLVEVLDDNHGYRLYQSVSRLKEALSANEEAEFLFEAGTIRMQSAVKRSDFDSWIAPELKAIEGAVDEALARAGLDETGVDRVFLTGGSLVRAGGPRNLPAPVRGRQDRDRRRVRVHRLGPCADRPRGGPRSLDHARQLGPLRRMVAPCALA